MSNIFIISPNLKIRVQNNKLNIFKEESKFFLKKDIPEKEVRLSQMQRLFILTECNIDEESLDTIKKRKIEIFFLDKWGNITEIIINKRAKLFLPTESAKWNISELIAAREIFSVNSVIKNSRIAFKRVYASNHMRETFSVLQNSRKYSDFRFIHGFNTREFYSILEATHLRFSRSYSFHEPRNITINFFHSLMFCLLISWFYEIGINPFNSCGFFFETENKNYPAFVKAVFTQFRIHTTMIALKVQSEIFNRDDIAPDKSLTTTGKLIVSKVFTEKFIHNKKIKNRFNDFWEDIKDKSLGKF